VGPDPCVDEPGTRPVGEGAGCVTDIFTVAQLTVASAASAAKQRESAGRRVRQPRKAGAPGRAEGTDFRFGGGYS
jgi:hypothetical protein